MTIKHLGVSIPQAVWIACNIFDTELKMPITSFNTASGMDCMQFVGPYFSQKKSNQFQYRKRYGLHAILSRTTLAHERLVSIPQAVWIACNTVPHSPWDS